MKTDDATRDEHAMYTPQRNAWLKAIRLEDETVPEWVQGEGIYLVPSNTTAGEWHGVWVKPDVPRMRPWWERLGCTCPAYEAGRVACWHRARVALYWSRAGEGTLPTAS